MIDIKKIDISDELFKEITSLYQEVWEEYDHEIYHRFIKHSTYEGYKGYISITANNKVVGFSYGYTSLKGQYYNGLLKKALNKDDSEVWLRDCFEFVELAVHPTYRKMGLGTQLINSMLNGLTHKTAILTTKETNHTARSLYKSMGWLDIQKSFLPDGKTPYVIMGKRL